MIYVGIFYLIEMTPKLLVYPELDKLSNNYIKLKTLIKIYPFSDKVQHHLKYYRKLKLDRYFVLQS